MKIQTYPQGYAVIDNTFNENELVKLWQEIDFIQDNRLLEDPNETGSAIDESSGRVLKHNRAVFLDVLFNENKIKYFLPIVSKLFAYQIAEVLEKIHPAFSIYRNLNYSTNLLSYYETGGRYETHTDNSVFTILTWLYQEPKAWTGGNLILNDFDTVIEVKNNRSLIIPGSFSHEVDPVIMNTSTPKMGRYCISQFGYVKPEA